MLPDFHLEGLALSSVLFWMAAERKGVIDENDVDQRHIQGGALGAVGATNIA